MRGTSRGTENGETTGSREGEGLKDFNSNGDSGKEKKVGTVEKSVSEGKLFVGVVLDQKGDLEEHCCCCH